MKNNEEDSTKNRSRSKKVNIYQKIKIIGKN